MRVAVHAGQLLQPVPGRHRSLRDRAARAGSPTSASTPIAFAAGERPRGVARRVPWIDLGPPRGSLRYELWHRLRRPAVRIDADLVHAPSLAIPPVRAIARSS